jgi:hypothetical protein
MRHPSFTQLGVVSLLMAGWIPRWPATGAIACKSVMYYCRIKPRVGWARPSVVVYSLQLEYGQKCSVQDEGVDPLAVVWGLGTIAT